MSGLSETHAAVPFHGFELRIQNDKSQAWNQNDNNDLPTLNVFRLNSVELIELRKFKHRLEVGTFQPSFNFKTGSCSIGF